MYKKLLLWMIVLCTLISAALAANHVQVNGFPQTGGAYYVTQEAGTSKTYTLRVYNIGNTTLDVTFPSQPFYVKNGTNSVGVGVSPGAGFANLKNGSSGNVIFTVDLTSVPPTGLYSGLFRVVGTNHSTTKKNETNFTMKVTVTPQTKSLSVSPSSLTTEKRFNESFSYTFYVENTGTATL
ncbi:hypothetical protein COY95_03290, partial [Candidatus Woesearchaeota archaeon CG_4_10_14_0_8_um_filter_47_5]